MQLTHTRRQVDVAGLTALLGRFGLDDVAGALIPKLVPVGVRRPQVRGGCN
jgi:hypothetical protein